MLFTFGVSLLFRLFVVAFYTILQSLKHQQSVNGATVGTNNLQETTDDCDDLVEVMRWPYEFGGLLESIDNEELPLLFMDLFEGRNVFYNGCVIVEMRDYRQSFQISNCCDTSYVLLKPTNQVNIYSMFIEYFSLC